MEQQKILGQFTPQDYARTFATYQKASTQYHDMKLLIKPILREMQGSYLDVMSIGAGDGCFEDALIKEKAVKVKYFYALEPDVSRRRELQNTVLSWNIDNYIDERGFGYDFDTDRRFDLILMSHVMYYFDDAAKAILKASSLLKANGVLIIFNQTEVGAPEVQKEFMKVSSLKSTPHSFLVTTASISRELSKIALAHEVTTSLSGVDITDFIQRKDGPTTNDVIDFILRTSFANFPAKIQSHMYAVLKGMCREEGGKYMLPDETGMIKIRNNQEI